jgi:hypothetical protein
MEAGEESALISLDFVDPGYFTLLGVRPRFGRLLTKDDDVHREPVLVLSGRLAGQLSRRMRRRWDARCSCGACPSPSLASCPNASTGSHPGAFQAAIPMGAVTLAVAFSVYPVFRASQEQAQTLRGGTHASRSRAQRGVARGAVAAEVAVSMVLVTAAGLFTTTLGNVDRVEGGFTTEGIILASVETRCTPYEQMGVGSPEADKIVRRVGAVPGIQAAAAATKVPLFGGDCPT